MERFTHSAIFFDVLSFHFHEHISWHGKLHLHMTVLTVCKYGFLQHNLSLQTDLCDLSDTFGSS